MTGCACTNARGSRPGNAVRLARIELQIKLLASVDERIDHLHGILHVHIVVTCAVDFKQMAFQVGGVRNGRPFLVRLLHIAAPGRHIVRYKWNRSLSSL